MASASIYVKFIKPLIDFFVALVMFLLLSPLFIVVTILLAVANGGKPFFLQPRPGKGGKIFRVIKYKTMNDRKDKNGELLPDAVRLTPIGKWVRRTSLDEVPQLLNVLKGDMSIIGPRPLLVEYLPLYSETQKHRHDVRPGITGWAQVNGRNAISWQQKFEYDVWYVNNVSFALDLRILLMTFRNVAKSEGISSETSATMEKFRGN
ncbi:MAG: sugar transferase [Flavipsychrobacter sp.]|nr:sugar transferase [Flavipsychrobacter sp.]